MGGMLRLDDEESERGRRAVHGNQVSFGDWLGERSAVGDIGTTFRLQFQGLQLRYDANNNRWVNPLLTLDNAYTHPQTLHHPNVPLLPPYATTRNPPGRETRPDRRRRPRSHRSQVPARKRVVAFGAGRPDYPLSAAVSPSSFRRGFLRPAPWDDGDISAQGKPGKTTRCTPRIRTLRGPPLDG